MSQGMSLGTVHIKNRAPAAQQITAEQLIREAQEFREDPFVATRTVIKDEAELKDYQSTTRKEFEKGLLSKARLRPAVWVKYAQWEARQKEFDRARSIYQRALEVESRNEMVWLAYAEMEMSNKFINYARNVWDRATRILPRVEKLWLKWVLMEETVGNIPGTYLHIYILTRIPIEQSSFILILTSLFRSMAVAAVAAVAILLLLLFRGLPPFLSLPLPLAIPFLTPSIKSLTHLLPFLLTTGARAIFDRWIKLQPPPSVDAWNTYVNFEARHHNLEGARSVYEQYLVNYNNVDTYLKYAKFEAQHGDPAKARIVYERAIRELEEDANDPRLFLAFARFEESQSEWERARRIYKYAIEHVPKVQAEELYVKYTAFEKQRGSTEGIEDVILAKRRYELETAVKANGYDYDAWFDYARMEETAAGDALDALDKEEESRRKAMTGYDSGSSSGSSNGSSGSNTSDITMGDDDGHGVGMLVESKRTGVARTEEEEKRRNILHARVREIYERAVANVPPSQDDKRLWRRYIFLWINYAVYEELVAENIERARAVLRTCLQLIPHKNFTFSQVWVLAAQLEVRDLKLDAARKLLGTAIGMCPDDAIFTNYIEIEQSLGNIDRCRELYKKYVSFAPHNVEAWTKFALLEAELSEVERARAIFELGISQPQLDMPEKLWTAYIEMEVERGEVERARKLYERLLGLSKHVKIWLAFAAFEAKVGGVQVGRGQEMKEGEREEISQGGDLTRARQVLETADKYLKNASTDMENKSSGSVEAVSLREERALLLKQWYELERDAGDSSKAEAVKERLPRRVKKIRRGMTETGLETMEEYVDYEFTDETVASARSQKLKDMAKLWKLKQQQQQQQQQ